jgi:hydrogenase maturation protease
MRHVIGFGNPLHGDDGVAATICAALQASALAPDVRVFDAGTRGLDALALLTGCDEAIMIDAAWPAGELGRIAYPRAEDVIAEAGLSGHVGGVGAVLRALTFLDPIPPRLRLVTIEAQRIVHFAPGLSVAVTAAARRVVADLAQELSAT